jgi:hypothetical protein
MIILGEGRERGLNLVASAVAKPKKEVQIAQSSILGVCQIQFTTHMSEACSAGQHISSLYT